MPLLAVITTRDWRKGLAAASRFAYYCPLVVAAGPRRRVRRRWRQRGNSGLRAAVSPASPARVLLEPAPVPDWEPTPAWWRFCEEIYGQAASAEPRA